VLITDRNKATGKPTVFLHVSKNAGTWMTHVLTKLYESKGRKIRNVTFPSVGKHGGVEHLNQRLYDSANIVAVVRDPADRVASQFNFAWFKQHATPAVVAWARERWKHWPDISFSEFLDFMLTDGRHEGHYLLPDNGMRIGRQSADVVRYFSRDPKSEWLEIDEAYIEEQKWKDYAERIHLIPYDSVANGLSRFLVAQEGFAEKDVAFIAESERVLPEGRGRSGEDTYMDYFTPELLDEFKEYEKMAYGLYAMALENG